MKISMLMSSRIDKRKCILAKQCGVNHIVVKLFDNSPPDDLNVLKYLKRKFSEFGLEFAGIEGDPFDMKSIKLGLDDRDQAIERYCRMLENMAELDIRLLCYNFMAGIGWFRTGTNTPERGGAMTSEFNLADISGELAPAELRIGKNQLWINLFYFLDAVLPLADKLGITMALHPDDPPLDTLKGISRILTSAEAFERVWQRQPVSANAITFCQATFKIMGENIESLCERWLKQRRIAFAHFRDVKGTKECFKETFHDNGPTDMAGMIKCYKDNGFTGLLRPDHAPAMYGEYGSEFAGGLSAGYEIMGKIFAIGYIKGLLNEVKR